MAGSRSKDSKRNVCEISIVVRMKFGREGREFGPSSGRRLQKYEMKKSVERLW